MLCMCIVYVWIESEMVGTDCTLFAPGGAAGHREAINYKCKDDCSLYAQIFLH